MTQDDLLQKIDERLERMEGDIKSLKGDVGTLKDGQAHANTALDALKAGQDDIRRDMATKDDIHWLASKIDKQKRRIENLEESTETPNPHKN